MKDTGVDIVKQILLIVTEEIHSPIRFLARTVVAVCSYCISPTHPLSFPVLKLKGL